MITKTFEEVFTYEALYRAHLRGRRCKRDKKPLVRFELTTLNHLGELHSQLMSGKYKVGKYHSFIVEEPKKREIQTLPYGNRVVQHVICDDLLAPYFTSRTIIDNCACQEGKGAHFALQRFENKLKDYVRRYGVNGYFLKCDILKYFPSMPHKLLEQTVCRRIQDEKIKKLICDIIESYHSSAGFLNKYGIEPLGGDGINTGRGIPIGNQTSQIFGMYYLDKVDRLVKEKLRVKVYSRYMDDFVLLHSDLQYVKYALEEIKKTVAELGLHLNSKTQIFPIKNGVTYLGFRFIVKEDGKVIKVVKKPTKRRMRWRAKLLKKAYLDNTIPIERVNGSLTAFHGHLMRSKSHNFERELQRKLTFEEKEKDIDKDKGEYKTMENEENKTLEALDKEIDAELGVPPYPPEGKGGASRKPFLVRDFDAPRDREMAVFTHAKKLSEYIFVITEKSPVKLRWNIVSRLLNCSVDIIENLYTANYCKGEERIAWQKKAMVALNLLDFYTDTAKTKQAISFRQMTIIVKQIVEVKKLLTGWVKATKDKL